jgi:hypothetical protein
MTHVATTTTTVRKEAVMVLSRCVPHVIDVVPVRRNVTVKDHVVIVPPST